MESVGLLDRAGRRRSQATVSARFLAEADAPSRSGYRAFVPLRSSRGGASVISVAQCKFSAVGPAVADCVAVGDVKQVVLPGKHGVAATAVANAVKTALPPWNGGPDGSAFIVIGMVLGVPSHGNSKAGKKPAETAEPWAIAVPAACSTCTLMFSNWSVSDGSNGEQVTVIGSVTATRPVRVGVPRVSVAAVAAEAVAARYSGSKRRVIAAKRLSWS
jgi:hypothetical protein